MNDNDIIKALECCIKNDCAKCKAYDETNGEIVDCLRAICRNALSLINRQKAEIERLEAMNSKLRIGIKVLKRNAIKDFAEEFERRCIQGGIYPAFIKATLNNLVKEYKQNDRA